MSVPNFTTSGVASKAAMSWGANRKMTTPMASASSTVVSTPKRTPLRVRSYSRPPRFWPTKVVRAMVKLLMGRNPKPSTLV